jgi:hypothetical protein
VTTWRCRGFKLLLKQEEEWNLYECALISQRTGETRVHLICDNYGTGEHAKVRAWLARRPRLHLHVTPTYNSWLNQVERWFELITNQAIRRGSFDFIIDLKRKIASLSTTITRGSEGTAGVCNAVALSAFITRGVMQWLYGCRLPRIPALQYIKRFSVPVEFAALAPITALCVASVWSASRTFTGIAVLRVSYSALVVITRGLLLQGYSRLKAGVTILFPRLEPRGC